MVQRAFLVGRSVASDLDLFESVVCLTLCSIISPWSAMRQASRSADSFLMWINTSSKPSSAISSLSERKKEKNYLREKNQSKCFTLSLIMRHRTFINPVIPMSDQERISPHNISPESHIKVMRIKKMITNKRSSWLLNKSSLSTPLEMCGEQWTWRICILQLSCILHQFSDYVLPLKIWHFLKLKL